MDSSGKENNIYTVYSGPNCPRCREVKAYMDSCHIAYSEINVREDNKALLMLKEAGFASIPQVFLNGVPFCNAHTYKEKL